MDLLQACERKRGVGDESLFWPEQLEDKVVVTAGYVYSRLGPKYSFLLNRLSTLHILSVYSDDPVKCYHLLFHLEENWSSLIVFKLYKDDDKIADILVQHWT